MLYHVFKLFYIILYFYSVGITLFCIFAYIIKKPNFMTLLELIKSYVKDSIEDKTRYNTDFGIGVFTTINYLYWGEYPTMSVKIRGGNSKSFNMNESSENEVVNWIFNNIK